MKDKKFYQDLAASTVKRISTSFDYVRVFVNGTEERTVEIRNEKPERCNFSESTSIIVVGARDGKTVSVRGSDISDSGIALLTDSIRELVTVVEPDPWYVVPDRESIGCADAVLKQTDPACEGQSLETLIDSATLLEKKALQFDSRLKSTGAFAVANKSAGAFACSYGFASGFDGTLFQRGISLAIDDQANDSENVGRKQQNGWSSMAVQLDLVEDLESIAEKAAVRTLSRLGAQKPPTGSFPIVFDPNAARSFFSKLTEALSGEQLYKGESFLCESKGKKVASDLLNIRELPLLPTGLGSRLFDADGVRARNFTVINKGVVENYLLSVYSGHRLGMASTGCSGGSANFVVDPGRGSVDDLISSMDRGILVTAMIGQGADIRTGDYSRGAEGFMIRNGAIAEPLSEFTISDTFQDMLMNIDAIADDARLDSTVIAPSIRIRRMTVGGA